MTDEASATDSVPSEAPAEREGAQRPKDAKPILRVVKGDLTTEELAALVAVISVRNAAAANAAARNKPKIRSAWGHPATMTRKTHHVGPDQWRRSAFGG